MGNDYGSVSAEDDNVPIVHAGLTDEDYEAMDPQAVTIDEDAPLVDDVTPLVTAHIADNDAASPAEPQFQDIWCALLFHAHFAVMLWLGIRVAPHGFEQTNIDIATIEQEVADQDDISPEDFEKFKAFVTEAMEYMGVYPQRILLYICLPSVEIGIVIAVVLFAFVIRPLSKAFVYGCLIGTFIWTVLIFLGGAVASDGIFGYILALFMLVGIVYYIYKAWPMVPFAAVNLKVAIEGMNRNCGTYLMALAFAELGFLWVIYWFYTVVGTSIHFYNACKERHPDDNFELGSSKYNEECDMPFPIAVAFLLSFYWTSTVIMNTTQVTVAGVMATWCFAPHEADNCCSYALLASLVRSVTYSFGSICFGSLMWALIAVLRLIVNYYRNERERENHCDGCGTALLCVLECIFGLLEDIIEYFNEWAYIFVGIYGFSYMESGKRVTELFRARGWTTIVTDNLVGYVLCYAAISVAIVTGVGAAIVEMAVSSSMKDHVAEGDSYIFGPLPRPCFWAFGFGFCAGFWTASVVVNVVRGAVNTLIVCWADSPAVMESNHPLLTKEMADAWTQVFPSESVCIQSVQRAGNF